MTTWRGCTRSNAIVALGSSIGMLATLGLVYGCVHDGVRRVPADRAEAIELATKELAKHGYAVHQMVVEADESNQKWQSYLRSTPELTSYYRNEIAKLEGKRYWAVYFAPAPIPNTLQGGGDAFVFVEAETRTILSVILFK